MSKQTIDEILDAVVMYYASDIDVGGVVLEMTTDQAKAALSALIDDAYNDGFSEGYDTGLRDATTEPAPYREG